MYLLVGCQSYYNNKAIFSSNLIVSRKNGIRQDVYLEPSKTLVELFPKTSPKYSSGDLFDILRDTIRKYEIKILIVKNPYETCLMRTLMRSAWEYKV